MKINHLHENQLPDVENLYRELQTRLHRLSHMTSSGLCIEVSAENLGAKCLYGH